MLFLYFLKKYLIPNLSMLSIEKFKHLARRVIFLHFTNQSVLTGLGKCISEKRSCV